MVSDSYIIIKYESNIYYQGSPYIYGMWKFWDLVANAYQFYKNAKLANTNMLPSNMQLFGSHILVIMQH